MKSLREQRGDSPPIYPVLQLQNWKVITSSIEHVPYRTTLNSTSASYIQGIFWSTYMSQPKEWDLQESKAQNMLIFQLSPFSNKHWFFKIYYRSQNLASQADLTSYFSGPAKGKFKAAEITQTQVIIEDPSGCFRAAEATCKLGSMRGSPKCPKHSKEYGSSFDGALGEDWLYSQSEWISANYNPFLLCASSFWSDQCSILGRYRSSKILGGWKPSKAGVHKHNADFVQMVSLYTTLSFFIIKISPRKIFRQCSICLRFSLWLLVSGSSLKWKRMRQSW